VAFGAAVALGTTAVAVGAAGRGGAAEDGVTTVVGAGATLAAGGGASVGIEDAEASVGVAEAVIDALGKGNTTPGEPSLAGADTRVMSMRITSAMVSSPALPISPASANISRERDVREEAVLPHEASVGSPAGP
jgi:hypothetical protein